MPDIFTGTSAKPNRDSHVKDSPTPEEVLKSVNKSSKVITTTGFFNPLASFITSPKSIRFVAKDSNEEIVLLLRKHPLTNLGWILLAILMFLAPSVLGFFPILSFLPERFQFIAVAMWYMLAVAYSFESFLDWFFNVAIITTETVFDVDFTNLIYREISEADLDNIQDVTVKMGGVVRTMFNYGDVFVQTAGEVPKIEFEAVPHPDKVAKILRELCFNEEKEKTTVTIADK